MVLAGIGTVGYPSIRNVVAYLDGGTDTASRTGAIQPVADAHDAVFQAVGRQRGCHDFGGGERETRRGGGEQGVGSGLQRDAITERAPSLVKRCGLLLCCWRSS